MQIAKSQTLRVGARPQWGGAWSSTPCSSPFVVHSRLSVVALSDATVADLFALNVEALVGRESRTRSELGLKDRFPELLARICCRSCCGAN